MNPWIERLPSGAVRITIAHDDSDSLAIITVNHRNGTLRTEVGMRGNYDVKQRPMQRTYVTMRAPLVSVAARLERKTRWLRGNAWRMR